MPCGKIIPTPSVGCRLVGPSWVVSCSVIVAACLGSFAGVPIARLAARSAGAFLGRWSPRHGVTPPLVAWDSTVPWTERHSVSLPAHPAWSVGNSLSIVRMHILLRAILTSYCPCNADPPEAGLSVCLPSWPGCHNSNVSCTCAGQSRAQRIDVAFKSSNKMIR